MVLEPARYGATIRRHRLPGVSAGCRIGLDKSITLLWRLTLGFSISLLSIPNGVERERCSTVQAGVVTERALPQAQPLREGGDQSPPERLAQRPPEEVSRARHAAAEDDDLRVEQVDEADQGVADAPAGGPEQPDAKGVPPQRRLVYQLGGDAPRVTPRELPEDGVLARGERLAGLAGDGRARGQGLQVTSTAAA